MATTLAVAITSSDGTITLSADPGSPFVKIDLEQLAITTPAGGPIRRAFQPDQQNPGGGVDATVQVMTKRGYNGTQAAPHAAGASCTPLYEALTATPGTLV